MRSCSRCGEQFDAGTTRNAVCTSCYRSPSAERMAAIDHGLALTTDPASGRPCGWRFCRTARPEWQRTYWVSR